MTDVERATILDYDQRFFDALTTADADSLTGLLADDFVLVTVNNGDIVPGRALIEAVRSKAVRFSEIQAFHDEALVRRIGEVAIVVGRTSMTFLTDDGTVTTGSRYTHVFQTVGGGWRLVSAQGTQLH